MPLWLSVIVSATGTAAVPQGEAAPAVPRAEADAQDGEATAPPPTPTEIGAAVERWLVTERRDAQCLRETIDLLLVRAEVGFAVLAPMVRGLEVQPADLDGLSARAKALRELATQTVLGYIDKVRASEMVFVGQYRELARLDPFATGLLFHLLLDTPNWFSYSRRKALIAPLRDLQQRLPALDRVDAIVDLIADRQEQLGLRQALAAMMWQWGRKEHAEGFLQELRAATVEGDGEDRVQATLLLAEYHYLLRDYRGAARAHRTAQVLAKGSGHRLMPINWYSAACVHALLGDVDKGMAALEQCVQLLASEHLDKSLRLPRKLFEKDPEIARLREQPRFRELLETAFAGREDAGRREAAGGARDGRR